MKKYFNPTNCNFYLEELKDTYEAAGNWPSTLVEVTDEVYNEFTSGKNPTGKMVGADKNGQPCWVDIPPPTHDQLVADAEQKKQQLLSDASAAIAPLQYAVDLDMATDDEKALLLKWKKYTVEVNRVDTDKAPDIVWPEKPA